MSQEWLGTTLYVSISSLVVITIGLVIREIRRSRKEVNVSEGNLKNERDVLEKRIGERTEEFVEAEKKNAENIGRMAQFGELSQGLFHDLMNPLTTLSLYLEKTDIGSKNSEERQKTLEKVIGISKRMNTFMDSVKRCFENNEIKKPQNIASVSRELEIVKDILAYKARLAGVKIEIEKTVNVSINIHPIRIHQIFSNLISNSIDACSTNQTFSNKEQKWIKISVIDTTKNIEITVADNGSGMTPEQLKDVFKKKMSTKSQGSGIGLITVHNIVTNELHGSISVNSKLGTGTVFHIIIPKII